MNRFLPLVCAMLALSAPLAGAQSPPPVDADPRMVWDLTRLFPTEAAWDTERLAAAAELPKLRELKGSLGRDAAGMRAALDQMSALRLRVVRLWVYASTQTSTDNGNRRNQERTGLMQALWGQMRPSPTSGATACTTCWRSARSRSRRPATRCSWPRSRRPPTRCC